MTASGWFCSVRICFPLSLPHLERKKNASEPRVRFTCWGQMSSWSQFPGFIVRSWERLSWCYCKLNELDWSGPILLFSNLSLLCFIATMYRGFFHSLHAFSWHDQWLAFDSCPWLGGLFIVGVVLSACSFWWCTYCVIFASVLMEVWSLCLDAVFVRCVLLCFLGCQYCTSEKLCVPALAGWVLLMIPWMYPLLCWILCACLHEPLGWPGFYWSFAGFLSAQVGIVMNRHFRELQSYGRWCLL